MKKYIVISVIFFVGCSDNFSDFSINDISRGKDKITYSIDINEAGFSKIIEQGEFKHEVRQI